VTIGPALGARGDGARLPASAFDGELKIGCLCEVLFGLVNFGAAGGRPLVGDTWATGTVEGLARMLIAAG
jgi:hypothetical protein